MVQSSRLNKGHNPTQYPQKGHDFVQKTHKGQGSFQTSHRGHGYVQTTQRDHGYVLSYVASYSKETHKVMNQQQKPKGRGMHQQQCQTHRKYLKTVSKPQIKSRQPKERSWFSLVDSTKVTTQLNSPKRSRLCPNSPQRSWFYPNNPQRNKREEFLKNVGLSTREGITTPRRMITIIVIGLRFSL